MTFRRSTPTPENRLLLALDLSPCRTHAIGTPTWATSDGHTRTSAFSWPRPPAPTTYELLSEALRYIRSYQADDARRVLESIRDITPRVANKIKEAHKVINAMIKAKHAIGLALVEGDRKRVLTAVESLKKVMFFRKDGSPRRGYQFPLPKTWIIVTCESFAFLGQVEQAECTLNRLMVKHGLNGEEQAWLMGIIAYAGGHVRTSLFLLRDIDPSFANLAQDLLKRVVLVQRVLDELESLNLILNRHRLRFIALQREIMLDKTFSTLEKCIRIKIVHLHTQKLDEAFAFLALPDISAVKPPQDAVAPSLKKAPSIPSISRGISDPVPRSSSTSALDSLRRKAEGSSRPPIPGSLEDMDTLD